MSKKYVTSFRGEYYTPNAKMHIKDEPLTPIDEDFGDHNDFEGFESDYGNMKKSMSMNDIATLREINRKNYGSEGSQADNESSVHPLDSSRNKFVSMAEAIYHYQRDTPSRFHTSRTTFKPQRVLLRNELTRPQSPMLRCKLRSRSQHIISQKEKEEMEMEEFKKNRIKAQPIPKSVLEGTKNLPNVPKKPVTVPEPFNLTEINKKLTASQKKLIESSQKVEIFKARPAPKHILEKPLKAVDATKKLVQHLKPSKPEPFSFAKRDEELKKRKEERIRQQIEEERRLASVFKAQPLPCGVSKQMQNATSRGSSSTSSENKENHYKFEARPAVVLHKEPFKPILKPAKLVQPAPFDLSTEKRAAEREQYEKVLKQKQEQLDMIRKQKEKEEQEAEERAQMELRSKLTHHAKPMPVFAPFVPSKSDAPLTIPETPKFVRRLRQN